MLLFPFKAVHCLAHSLWYPFLSCSSTPLPLPPFHTPFMSPPSPNPPSLPSSLHASPILALQQHPILVLQGRYQDKPHLPHWRCPKAPFSDVRRYTVAQGIQIWCAVDNHATVNASQVISMCRACLVIPEHPYVSHRRWSASHLL